MKTLQCEDPNPSMSKPFNFLATWILLVWLLGSATQVSAQSLYLPLDLPIADELAIEKLQAQSQMPQLSRPYSIKRVSDHLNKVQLSDPLLYQQIQKLLKVYEQTYNLTLATGFIHAANQHSKSLPNQRGITSGSNLELQLASYWKISEYMALNLGGILHSDIAQNASSHTDFIANNSYLSLGSDYLQLDLGYRESWLSPFQLSAMLQSTNAKPVAQWVLSNPQTIGDWQFSYQLAYGKLETMEGISFNQALYRGRPGFLTMHTSFQPIEGWTIGATRSLVFGGGPREIDSGTIWNAIIDPVNSDNCGGQSELQDCDLETGNQQAAISQKFDFNWGTPISLLLEVAGEDTNDYKAYKLGNKAYSLGVFFPQLTEDSSLSVEIQQIENGWYTHHLYQQGYRNDLHSIGHWWGDEKDLKDPIGARIFSLRHTTRWLDDYLLQTEWSHVKNQNVGDEAPSDPAPYHTAQWLKLSLSGLNADNPWVYQLYAGNDVWNQNFYRLSLGYYWQ